jgi:alkylation response protein AidB-like acyl-CoA dehydrogenase
MSDSAHHVTHPKRGTHKCKLLVSARKCGTGHRRGASGFLVAQAESQLSNATAAGMGDRASGFAATVGIEVPTPERPNARRLLGGLVR